MSDRLEGETDIGCSFLPEGSPLKVLLAKGDEIRGSGGQSQLVVRTANMHEHLVIQPSDEGGFVALQLDFSGPLEAAMEELKSRMLEAGSVVVNGAMQGHEERYAVGQADDGTLTFELMN